MDTDGENAVAGESALNPRERSKHFDLPLDQNPPFELRLKWNSDSKRSRRRWACGGLRRTAAGHRQGPADCFAPDRSDRSAGSNCGMHPPNPTFVSSSGLTNRDHWGSGHRAQTGISSRDRQKRVGSLKPRHRILPTRSRSKNRFFGRSRRMSRQQHILPQLVGEVFRDAKPC